MILPMPRSLLGRPECPYKKKKLYSAWRSQKSNPTSFPPVTSTNIGIGNQKRRIFSFNSLATQV